jgi:hypothetical protein
MTGSDIIKTFFAATPARHIRIAAAKRMLPLPAGQTLDLLVRLLKDQDAEVASTAKKSLESTPAEEVLMSLRSPDCSAEIFEHFSQPGASPGFLEAIALNPTASGHVITTVASHAPAPVLEVVLFNRVRVLEHPEIIESIRQNPSATGAIERLLLEIEQEFFSGKKQGYTVAVAETPAAVSEPIEELGLEELVLEGLPLEPAAREKALTDRLSTMTIPHKLRFATLGNRDVRAILIRDANKQVSRAVLKNPKLSDTEVESFARMRNVAEDVLRDIANSREWTRSYGVVHALVLNPKTPPTLTQRMMFRLTTRDLTNVTRDRGVPDIVRRTAQQTVAQRSRAREGA